MNINCTNNCINQQDGKCGLTEITAAAPYSINTMYMYSGNAQPQGNCPYYSTTITNASAKNVRAMTT